MKINHVPQRGKPDNFSQGCLTDPRHAVFHPTKARVRASEESSTRFSGFRRVGAARRARSWSPPRVNSASAVQQLCALTSPGLWIPHAERVTGRSEGANAWKRFGRGSFF